MMLVFEQSLAVNFMHENGDKKSKVLEKISEDTRLLKAYRQI